MILEKIRSVLFLKIGARVLDLQLDTQFLGSNGPNVVSRPQTSRASFTEFLGISWRKKSPGLIRPLAPNHPKLVFRPQTPTPKYHNFEIYFFKLHKILHKTSPYFQILGHFRQNYECLFPENCKKTSKIFFLVPF